ncbi:U-box domain-containing protein 9-like [Gossypium hirsutum]|uniref:U-box domain-containing protein 9-like n=1 Tax=Gossypium hirsutum TaxID=3635 RepID=A0A1U8LSB8_GOSHI|nr:U-box domain-containing protein 9-like [Gossypium hirsutum]
MAETGESSLAKEKEPSSMAETGDSLAASGEEPSSIDETGESSLAKETEPYSMAETGESPAAAGEEPSSMTETGESLLAKEKEPSSIAETGESPAVAGEEPSSMAKTGKSSLATGKDPSSMAETGESPAAAGEEPSSMTEKGKSPAANGKEQSSMAETGDSSSSVTGEVRELKKELQSVVRKILEEDDDDDNRIDTIGESIRILSRLREMKLNQPAVIGMDDDKGKAVLPPKQDGDSSMSSPSLVMGNPFVSVSNQALKWMKSNEAKLKSQEMMDASRLLANLHLERLSGSFSDKVRAARELSKLTKSQPAYRAIFAELPDSITKLLGPLLSEDYYDPELEQDLSYRVSKLKMKQDLMEIVLDISTDDNNKQHMAEHPSVIPLLDRTLYTGTMETTRTAAMTLVSLLSLESNKFIIGKSTIPAALLRFVDIEDAAAAILSLCTVHENIAKFNKLGAIKVMSQKIDEGILVDQLLAILAVLSSRQDVFFEYEDVDAFRRLVEHRRNISSQRAENTGSASAAIPCFTRR